MSGTEPQRGSRAELGTVGSMVRTDDEAELTRRAFEASRELGWDEGSLDAHLAFVSGYRVGAREADLTNPPRP